MWIASWQGEFILARVDRPSYGYYELDDGRDPFFLQAGQKPDLIRLNLVVQERDDVD